MDGVFEDRGFFENGRGFFEDRGFLKMDGVFLKIVVF